jgi:hypothetical protein
LLAEDDGDDSLLDDDETEVDGLGVGVTLFVSLTGNEGVGLDVSVEPVVAASLEEVHQGVVTL